MLVTPELRKRRWIIFSVLALSYILVYFYRVSLAVVANDVAQELSLGPKELGLLSGILFYVYAGAQLPLGPLIDRFGGRLVIGSCGVLTTLGGVLFSQTHSLATALVARSLIGIGTAAVLMSTFAIFSHWYPRQEFGKVSGFMVAVGNLGNLAATAPLALAVGVIGWRSSFISIALLQAVATVLVFLLVRNAPPATAVTPREEQPRSSGAWAAWGTIFGTADFLRLGAISFAWYGNYLALQGLWGGPYLMEVVSLTRAGAGNMLMGTSLGFICGSLLSDLMVRRLFKTHKRALVAGQATLLALMTAFLGWGELLPQVVLPILFFVIGLAVSSGVMIYPIIRSMFPLEIVGTALTSLNFFVLLGAAVIQQMMGFIIEIATQRGFVLATAYHYAFLLPIVVLVATILLFLPARDYH